MRIKKFPWWKLVVGFLLYFFHHEAFDIFGGGVLGSILGERIEAVFPHMKMLFFAYLEISVVDYFIQRSKGALGSAFFTSRMFILSIVPWLMIAIYFIFEALGIPLPGTSELIWGIIMTLGALYFAIRLEEVLDNLEMRGSLKALIVLAFVCTLIMYLGFSFHVPDNFFYVDR